MWKKKGIFLSMQFLLIFFHGVDDNLKHVDSGHDDTGSSEEHGGLGGGGRGGLGNVRDLGVGGTGGGGGSSTGGGGLDGNRGRGGDGSARGGLGDSGGGDVGVAAGTGGDRDTERVANVQVQAVGAQLVVPLEEIGKGAAVGGSESVASSVGG